MLRATLVFAVLATVVMPMTAVGADEPQRDGESRHWAFAPLQAVEPPPTTGSASDQPIDRFVAAKRQAAGLGSVGLAEKRVLARRAYFDLIGLPPPPDELERFVEDDSPAAFTELIDRLLASPHYGERFGRHWLDVVRYADTAGDNADYPIPEARRYRDYVIDAMNGDLPYDQFVREQLAGDLMAREEGNTRYAEQIVATSFLALSRRYATGPYELWHLTLEDSIETTGRAFLGLTLRCARCHDHKFDPFTREDYYGLYGIFASTQFPYAGSEEFQSQSRPRAHFVPLLRPEESAERLAAHVERLGAMKESIEQSTQHDPFAREVAELDQRIKTLTERKKDSSVTPEEHGPMSSDSNTLADSAENLESLRGQRDEAQQRLDRKIQAMRNELRGLERAGLPPDVPAAYAVSEGTPADATIHVGGDPGRIGDLVERRVPALFEAASDFDVPDDASGRLELARWLTTSARPLVARVMVNRIWRHHFGTGIVSSPSNFGTRGARPTHPELLDWLAGRFIECGWSVKAMHRLIMSSETYQLASDSDDARAAVDPDNRLLWRHNRRRLEAESIRDAMLALAGNLNPSRPGVHPFPLIASWNWTQHTPFRAAYPSAHRSVYLMTQRIDRHPYLALFDGPDPNYSTGMRTEATVATQALYLMNNPFVGEQAEAFARQIAEAETLARERIQFAHLSAWGRAPSNAETESAIEYLDRCRQALSCDRGGNVPSEITPWASYARVLLLANEFMYVD